VINIFESFYAGEISNNHISWLEWNISTGKSMRQDCGSRTNSQGGSEHTTKMAGRRIRPDIADVHTPEFNQLLIADIWQSNFLWRSDTWLASTLEVQVYVSYWDT
jgi:hypothetical protein